MLPDPDTAAVAMQALRDGSALGSLKSSPSPATLFWRWLMRAFRMLAGLVCMLCLICSSSLVPLLAPKEAAHAFHLLPSALCLLYDQIQCTIYCITLISEKVASYCRPASG